LSHLSKGNAGCQVAVTSLEDPFIPLPYNIENDSNFVAKFLSRYLEATSLMLITLAVLGIALASLAYRAPARQGYRPLGIGVIAASLIFTEKFWLPSPVLLALDLTLLIGASLWNAWPRQATAPGACAACTPTSIGEVTTQRGKKGLDDGDQTYD
jgi:hypothetical protein